MAGRQVAREAGREGDTVGQWNGWDVGTLAERQDGREAERQICKTAERQEAG
jgi:hypothetical protein